MRVPQCRLFSGNSGNSLPLPYLLKITGDVLEQFLGLFSGVSGAGAHDTPEVCELASLLSKLQTYKPKCNEIISYYLVAGWRWLATAHRLGAVDEQSPVPTYVLHRGGKVVERRRRKSRS